MKNQMRVFLCFVLGFVACDDAVEPASPVTDVGSMVDASQDGAALDAARIGVGTTSLQWMARASMPSMTMMVVTMSQIPHRMHRQMPQAIPRRSMQTLIRVSNFSGSLGGIRAPETWPKGDLSVKSGLRARSVPMPAISRVPRSAATIPFRSSPCQEVRRLS
jgi:hypothetical protein